MRLRTEPLGPIRLLLAVVAAAVPGGVPQRAAGDAAHPTLPEVALPPAPVVRDPADLGARVETRAVAVPDVPRGTSTAFRFDGDRRGWVAAVPVESVLPSVAWARGKVVVGGGFTSQQVYAFDAETGALAWELAAQDGGPSSAIVVRDKVLFNTESCTLFCADAGTGRLLWKKYLGDPMMSLPAASDDLVYTAHAVSGGHRLTALSIGDGQERWGHALDADVLGAPVVAGADVLVTTMGGRVLRFDARLGRLRWSAAVEATSAPWVRGDRIYVARRAAGGREQITALALADGAVLGAGPAFAATYAAGRPDAGGTRAGWSYEGSRPTLVGDRSYVAIGNELRARELETGREVWRRRVPTAGRERGMTPPAVVGGQLVVGTRDGELVGMDVDTGLTTFAYRIGEPIAFQPIVANGWVYATTTRGRVVALEVADRGWDGWHMWGGSPGHLGAVAPSAVATMAGPARPGEGTLRAAASAGEALDLPLVETRITARAVGPVAEVELEQVFVNDRPRAVDAVYLFPLPPDAAVDRMELRIGTRVVRATIRRRAEARETFEAARGRGATAALLEHAGADLFRQEVANVAVGATVRVALRFGVPLAWRDGDWELALPLVATPRYAPGARGPGAPPLPAPESRPARSVHFTLDVDAGVPLGPVSSPTHTVAVRPLGPARAHVTLGGDGTTIPNRDLVVRWRAAGAAPRVAVLSTPGQGAGSFTLLVHPQTSAARSPGTPREVMLLVDASSSMSGVPLAQARAVAAAMLAGLGPSDTFRLVRFSDRTTALDAAALAASPANLARARTFLAAMEPGGGTEVITALGEALAVPATSGRMRVVVLVTDGWVGREEDVLRAAEAPGGDARLFTVGVGPAPNRFILERLAERGRGEVDVAALGDPPGVVGARVARRLARPVLTDLAVEWGDLPVRDVVPRRLPDLWADRPLALAGHFERPSRGTVRLTGRLAGRPWSTEVAVELGGGAGADVVASVWARRRVHELETARALRSSPALRAEIERLGLVHGLVTTETSFVAVDRAPPVARFADPTSRHIALETMSASMNLMPSGGESSVWANANPDFGGGGALDLGGVHRSIQARLPAVRRLYQRALRADPNLAGQVTVTFVVGTDGRVVSVQRASGTLDAPSFVEALLALVRTWRFAPSASAQPTTFQFPFVFAPGG